MTDSRSRSRKPFRAVAGIVVGVAITVGGTGAFAQTPLADLTVGETAPEQSAAGTDVAFTVTVGNNGPDPAVNAAITNPVPNGATFVSALQNSGPAFSCAVPAGGAASGSVTCSVASFAAAASAAFTFVFHIEPATPAGTFITSVGTVSTDTFDPNDENDSGSAVTQTPPPPAADLRVTKVGPAGANPNTDVTYTIELTNGGPGAATVVDLEDTIPGDMTLVSVTQTSGPTLACASGAGGTISCTVATFAAGAVASLTVVGHIPASAGSGATYQNFVTVTSNFDPNSENDTATTLVCVQTNSCQAGPCNQNSAIVCAAPDQCHGQGACDTVTGACAPNPPKVDGASCNDGNACTQSDTCQAGVCTGAGPVICPAADTCHTQGSCDPVTGVCASNPPKGDGAGCDDGNACTQADTCAAGVCAGVGAVVCPVPDQCHDQGSCVAATGVCAPNPPKANGTACDDGNACTQPDSCQAGVCQGANTALCPTPDQCHDQGACNIATGACAASPPKSDGVGCDDGNVCTQSDSCQAGVCHGGAAPSCDDGNPCTVDSCDSVAGCQHTGVCDAAIPDAAAVDASLEGGVDVLPSDASPGDGGGDLSLADASFGDAGAFDAAVDGPADGSVASDGGRLDGGLDGGADAARDGVGDGGTPVASSSSGCGCRTAGGTGAPSAGLVLFGLLLAGRWRSRRPRRTTRSGR